MSDIPSGGEPEELPPADPQPPPTPLFAPLPPPLPAPGTSAWRNFLATLWAGLQLALLRKPALDGLRLGPGLFWALLLCAVPLAVALSSFSVEAPRHFDRWGLESQAAYFLYNIFLAFVLARMASKSALLWPIAILITSASLLQDLVNQLIVDHALRPAYAHHPRWYWAYFGFTLIWLAAMIFRVLVALQALRSRGRALLAAALVTALTVGMAILLPQAPLWHKDYLAESAREKGPPLVAEEVFSRQDELLDRALLNIAPTRPGRPSLYFVAYAPDSEQDVFRKEALYSTRLFAERFGAAQRSLTLVNSRSTVNDLPLASTVNLDRGLRAIGRKMNPQQDILFLYLTSHGSRDAELATELDDLSFSTFNAPRLAQILRDSGIRWKVIVVSACYSGSFLNSLKDDHTLVMTAARADRTSFGCSDDAEFTYFGRAYLEQALNQTTSFTEAFAKARTLVDQWETRDQEVHSEPQIAKGALIEAKLEQWRATLPAAGQGVSAASGPAARPGMPARVNRR